MPNLFIDDGYSARAGFNGGPNQAAMEMDIRPFAGMDGHQRYAQIQDGADATGRAIADMLGDTAADPPKLPRISNWDLPRPLTAENLRKLRGPEFVRIMLAMYDVFSPDYEVVEGDDGEEKRVPWGINANAEKN